MKKNLLAVICIVVINGSLLSTAEASPFTNESSKLLPILIEKGDEMRKELDLAVRLKNAYEADRTAENRHSELSAFSHYSALANKLVEIMDDGQHYVPDPTQAEIDMGVDREYMAQLVRLKKMGEEALKLKEELKSQHIPLFTEEWFESLGVFGAILRISLSIIGILLIGALMFFPKYYFEARRAGKV